MPCWPDIWTHWKEIFPEVLVFASLAVYTALVILLFMAPKLRTQWQREVSRALGALLVIPLLFALPALLLGIGFAHSGPPAQSRIMKSPNGQEATLNYSAGFLGRDYTEMTLKQTGCCRHMRVFWNSGPSSFSDPRVEWQDDRHLLLTYHARPADPSHCEHQLQAVVITCIPLSWPEASGTSTRH